MAPVTQQLTAEPICLAEAPDFRVGIGEVAMVVAFAALAPSPLRWEIGGIENPIRL